MSRFSNSMDIEYPSSDGRPMAENTLQFEWIAMLKGGLDKRFRHDRNVFVAGDLLWYPVEGDNRLRVAPDAMVVFGRPKGHRGSYLQWREDGIAPQVVFEVLSPGNRKRELAEKLAFYDRFGVDEYYLISPEQESYQAWLRHESHLQPITPPQTWMSPRLSVTFDRSTGSLQLRYPDGTPFLTYLELVEFTEAESRRAAQAIAEADQEAARADHEAARAERLERRLRELGIDPTSS